MKELFVLTLVLGVASLASAGIEIVPGLEYEVSGNTLTISGTNISSYWFNLQADDSSVLSDGFAYVDYFYIPENPPHGEFINGQWLVGVGYMNPPYSGPLFSIDFESTATTISFVYSSLVGVPNVHFGSGPIVDLAGKAMIVPEPVTMALLGLGGLLLGFRRKSK